MNNATFSTYELNFSAQLSRKNECILEHLLKKGMENITESILSKAPTRACSNIGYEAYFSIKHSCLFAGHLMRDRLIYMRLSW